MKKFILLFAVCLVSLGFHAVYADEETDAARAAKRGTSNIIISSRQKSDNSDTSILSSASRSVANGKTETSNDRSIKARDAAIPRNVQNTPRSVNVQPRATIVNQRVSERTSAVNRSAVEQPTGVASRARSATRISADSNKYRTAARNIVRAGEINNEIQPAINPATNYKKCREVYYSCMDEFCANKDTQLKRCACSVRAHDFDKIKQNMSSVEDKILTFNERLLSVNMDKEDAAAMSKATEGETAYQKTDNSDSKGILDEISKKLKASTTDTNLNKNLSAISLSLDTDSAFDSIDSSLGASTAIKEGADLYNAALPVCREMVAEVCDEEGASIAESGYQMAVEQDCNTVSRAYENMQSQAIEKAREGSALLDMSRLDLYQKNNSDDILACKKKMLTMMTDTSVCGTDLSKCLDVSGKYIDPSTGTAFLTVNLVNLNNLITRPSSDQKWTEVSGNSVFVSFLNSKKKYMESSMENCKDISDTVWDDFIEDALSQIKLAQQKKLEDMRQSCTSLTTQCLASTSKSVSEFDARALSIFGISADKTVNEMCSGVKTACTALLKTSGGDSDWVGGMSEIETDKTYDTIIQTCREVGKACIIQTCKSVSGNFGLCESIARSVNRKSIVNRSACWKDVLQCVADAGTDSIGRIMTKYNKVPTISGGDFYSELYGNNIITTNYDNPCDPLSKSCVYDICASCGTASNQPDCGTCRLAEKIWGNCEFQQNIDLNTIPNKQNRIKETTSDNTQTLLSWFAENTGTTDSLESCRDTSCGAGYIATTVNGETTCELAKYVSSNGERCADNLFDISQTWTNCCITGYFDDYGNCCTQSSKNVNGFNTTTNTTNYYNPSGASANICTPASNTTVTFVAAFYLAADSTYYKSGTNILLCVGGNVGDMGDTNPTFPGGQTIKCSGYFIVLNNTTGIYTSPDPNISTFSYSSVTPNNFYKLDLAGKQCIFDFDASEWKSNTGTGGAWVANPTECNKVVPPYPTNNSNVNSLFIKY